MATMIVLVLAVIAMLINPSMIRAQITAGGVEFDAHPSSDFAGSKLSGVLYKPSGYSESTADAYSAVVMMHGCSGMWSNQNINAVNSNSHFALPGAPNLQNYIEKWGIKLAQSGIVALAVDSFTKRRPSAEPIVEWQRQCSGNTYAGRVSSYTERVFDLQAGFNFLDSKPEIKSLQIAALGWSHGAQATMVEAAVTERSFDTARIEATKFFRTISFYPGCGTDLGFGAPSTGYWRPFRPLHLHVGKKDGFYQNCKYRATQAASLTSVVTTFPEIYEDAYHSFDNVAEVWPASKCAVVTGDECAMRSADIDALAFLQAAL